MSRRRGLGLGAWMRWRRGRRSASDLVKLCQGLQLDGWERLTGKGGAVIVTVGDPAAREAPWHTVATAVAAWAGPLSLLDPGPVARERVERLGLAGLVELAEARDRLARGERILVLTASGHPSPVVVELAAESGARSLRAVLELSSPQGRRRLVVESL